jgi:hypothetical protein
MQNSLHAFMPKTDDENPNLRKIQKKRKSALKQKENTKNENKCEQNVLSFDKPLFLYTDKKTFLLFKRTYYMRELEKTENFINSEKFMDKRLNLTYDEFSRLLAEFNNLLKLQNLYINFEDLFRSLQLQNKIINILKVYIINKMGEK